MNTALETWSILVCGVLCSRVCDFSFLGMFGGLALIRGMFKYPLLQLYPEIVQRLLSMQVYMSESWQTFFGDVDTRSRVSYKRQIIRTAFVCFKFRAC
jgi:hypothetical protein